MVNWHVEIETKDGGFQVTNIEQDEPQPLLAQREAIDKLHIDMENIVIISCCLEDNDEPDDDDDIPY